MIVLKRASLSECANRAPRATIFILDSMTARTNVQIVAKNDGARILHTSSSLMRNTFYYTCAALAKVQ